jgi:plastocyanin
MRRILCIPLVLALAGPAPVAAAQAAPTDQGRVVGATVAVSGTPAPTPAPSAVAPQRATPIAHAAAAGSVAIRDFSFGPSSITVHVGDTVTWANAGPTDHTATANDGAFDTGTLKAGQSGSHTFASAGTFAYHCTLHPFMRGTVEVVAAASAPAPSGGSATTGTATPAASPATTAPALPNTGLEALWLVAGGVLCLLIGLLLRAFTGKR